MATELQIIGSRDILGKTVNAYGDFENPLFLAKDVGEWIEHSNYRVMIEPIEDDEKDVRTVYTPGGPQESWFLTEAGLYEVLMLSRKPIAKEFKKGVKQLFHDIRTGKAKVVLSDDEMTLLVITNLQRRIADNNRLIAEQQARITEDAPKVEFYDLVKHQNALCHFQGLANVLHNHGFDIGRNRLIADFRQNGDIQIKDALLTQKALDRGIGQNVQTGSFEMNGVTQLSFRAFLNLKGIIEVFDRYGLTAAQRDLILDALTD
jgi:prophage antirepressor-like protein